MGCSMKTQASFRISSELQEALRKRLPVVALESTVITHGLPLPDNLLLATEMEATIRKRGAVPATIAVINGEITVGASPVQLELLAQGKGSRKLSSRDLASAIVKKENGGTTVAGTAFCAHRVGIRVFATGGIGGVHRGNSFDISADLFQLSKTPVIVVCAGAKAILDLDATIEILETLSIPVIGYQTGEFPAFYSTSSGLKTAATAQSPEEVAAIARVHWEMGMESAVLVVVPPPEDAALPKEMIEIAIQTALASAEGQGVRGQEVTPFLLDRVSTLTSGASLRSNLALLKNNAELAADIANQLNLH